MCGEWLCPELPQTNLVVRVAYCHQDHHWHARVEAESLTSDGTERHHGRLDIDFGPDKGRTDVYAWIRREVNAQLPLMVVRDNVE